VCKCVLYFCHRVTTQLQLTKIYVYISYKMCICLFILYNYKEKCSDWLLLSSCIGCRLLMMKRVGILDRIYRRFAFKIPPKTDNMTVSVHLHDTVPLFIILATGIAISLCVFVACECAVRCAHVQSHVSAAHNSSIYIKRCKITC
jgi:hypothetical protein